MKNRRVAIVGVGSGWGAADMRAADGPITIITEIKNKYPQIPIYYKYYHECTASVKERRQIITRVLDELYTIICDLKKAGYFIIVLTGDHTYVLSIQSALSTASGRANTLLYIDAHMDAHTPRSSESKNPHGMPNSTILGYGGYKEWKKYSSSVNPQNFYLFGARSFEPAEDKALNKIGAYICYMMDLKTGGNLDLYLRRAIKNTQSYSMSIDVDAFDPAFMPGTGYREPNGIHPREILNFLSYAGKDKKCELIEITEYNPHKDINKKSLRWIMKFIDAIL